MADELLEMAEAARKLGISPGELSDLVSQGKLKSVDVDGVPKFRAADLEAYLAGQAEELVLLPEEEEKERETEAIPLAGVTPEAKPEAPSAEEEPTVEVSAGEGESLFADEGLAEVEEVGEVVSAAEVAAVEAAEKAGEPVTPALDAFAVPRRDNPAMTVVLVVSLVLLVITGILVMNFIKFETTGGAPQGIVEWLTSKIPGVAG